VLLLLRTRAPMDEVVLRARGLRDDDGERLGYDGAFPRDAKDRLVSATYHEVA